MYPSSRTAALTHVKTPSHTSSGDNGDRMKEFIVEQFVPSVINYKLTITKTE